MWCHSMSYILSAELPYLYFGQVVVLVIAALDIFEVRVTMIQHSAKMCYHHCLSMQSQSALSNLDYGSLSRGSIAPTNSYPLNDLQYRIGKYCRFCLHNTQRLRSQHEIVQHVLNSSQLLVHSRQCKAFLNFASCCCFKPLVSPYPPSFGCYWLLYA